MKPSSLFVILSLLVMYGCTNLQKPKQTLQEKQKELDVGELDEKYVYTAKEVGWTAVLPEDWQVFTRRDNDKIVKEGKEMVEDASGARLDDSRLVHLVSIRKDFANLFQSTLEPADDAIAADYDNHTVLIHDLIKQIYESKGIPADYVSGAAKIDGIWFDRLEVKLYSKDKKKVILEQKLFNALINGNDFAMTISYDNSTDAKTLMNIVTGSKFSIKQ